MMSCTKMILASVSRYDSMVIETQRNPFFQLGLRLGPKIRVRKESEKSLISILSAIQRMAYLSAISAVQNLS